jgi:hypothetical protein
VFRPSRIRCEPSALTLFISGALLLAGSGPVLAYTVTDFAVDPAHATLGNPHEVASASFANFQLTIYGTFNVSKCYQVTIKHEGGGVCGSANSSGTDTAEVFADHLVADVSPNASADFKAAADWRIEIAERAASCNGGSATQTFPDDPGEPYLRIRGCDNTCTLTSPALTITPNPVGCVHQAQVCVTAGGTGNLEYDWDLNGNGVCGVCSGGTNNGKKCGEATDCPGGGVCVGGGGFDDLTTNTHDLGCLIDQPCCVTVTITTTHTVGVKVRDKNTTIPCTACATKLITVIDDCSDGLFCNGVETCISSVCQDNADPCAPQLKCDEAHDRCVTCLSDAQCNDGLFCNGVETCNAATGACVAGTPVNCNDGVSCTTDTCNEATDSCVHTPNNAACSDGLFCNGTETCDPLNGCQAGTPPNCSDGVGCTVDACDEANDTCTHTPQNSLCNDGQFCNGTETCHPTLGCQAGTPPNCNDGVSCTLDSCDEVNDTCKHVTDNSLCSDGLFCNGNETCHPTLGCQPGTPPNCNDGIACTVDTCDEAHDTCVHTPNNGACDDGQFCNGAETCNPASGCQAGTPPNCNDGIACTVDSCDEAKDTCKHVANNAACDNGLFCDGAEYCDPLNGCKSGTPPNCNDGVACTVDSCDEANDTCKHTPNDAACSNGLFCDGAEFCDPVLGCQDNTDPCAPPLKCDEAHDRCVTCLTDVQCNDGLFCNGAETCNQATGTCAAGTPPSCSDGIACTVDVCNTTTDQCEHTPNNGACSNGLFCDGDEVCDAALGCKPGAPPNCDDGIACTVDACDEAADTCTHTANNAACSDGLFCNGAETCHPTNGCQPGTPPNCNDGVPCTVDACDEAADTCTHTPANSLCSDGLFCNGVETCNPALGCQTGTPPNCNDGIGCTVDVCDEANDRCEHPPDDSLCNDGQFCNGVETCDPLLGCKAGTPPNCSDGVMCTVDACDEVHDTCVNTPDDSRCNDMLFCNGVERCDLLLDCQPGTPPNCNDGVACTVDACDEAADACTHTPNDAFCNDNLFCDGVEFCDAVLGCRDNTDPCAPPLKCDEPNDRCVTCLTDAQCNDGLFCNGVETCSPVTGTCTPGTPPSCDDGIACTVDSCSGATDSCAHTPDNTACSNGLFCDGNEVCNPTLGCQPGTPPNCDDGVACTVDTCNETTDSCDHTPNNAFCSDGLFCDGAETCDSLNGCQPGTPPNCNDGVACTVDACNETTDSCDHTPSNAFCDDGKFCTGAETCDPIGGCKAGTPPTCDDGVSCTVDACDAATDACKHTANNGLCANGLFCDGVEICDPQTGCHPGPAVNCDDSVACTADSCDEANDICVHIALDTACSDGLYCNGVERCDLNLGCQPGVGPSCDDGIGCTTDACNESTDTCDHTPNNAVCDDGVFCNGAEACSATAGCQPGTPPTCDDGVACTIDSCAGPSDACAHSPSNAFCDDHLFCNGVETCDPVNGCQPGTPPNCNDNIACTVDSCDEAADACAHTPNDAACDDGLFCDGHEYCDPALGCQDNLDPCNLPLKCDEPNDRCVNCLSDAQCNDGVFCNGLETCDQPTGVCVPGTPPTCDDGVPCTVDRCDATLDACTHTADNGVCDDGLFCTGAETCDPVNGCQPGTPPDCNDGVSCTVDACDEVNDRCKNTPDNSLCDNGLFCDGAETCNPISGCQPGSPPKCNDGVSCTLDFCNEDTDRCEHTPDNTACDDHLFCNGVETCDPLNGCRAGTPPNCDDGVACTIDACNETMDRCDHTPNDAVCNDNLFCNGLEFCDLLNGCHAGTPPNCNDGVSCTADSCDEVHDTCAHAPNDASCSDGLFCNGLEVCDPINGCKAGTPPNCNDGIACTVDGCDETNDTCTHTPNNTLCDDTLFCNGPEVCNPTVGCQSGPAPNCNDGVACTLDSCNETKRSCVHAPNDGACNDGLFCNGVETCDRLNGCRAGTPPNCKDGIGCTVDTCDEATDTCRHQPKDALCDDSRFCDGVETCNPNVGCVTGPPPGCSDLVACTIDACDTASDRCTHLPSNALCGDGDDCTVDACTPGGCTHQNMTCGACCLPAGPCADHLTAEGCAGIVPGGGVFQGAGSVCLGDADGRGLDDLCDTRGTIPTVSEWGLVIMTLLLLTGAKIYFSRRQPSVSVGVNR